MKYIVTLFRILVGGLFIFSGFVKAIDPLGTSYKITEYFVEFGMGFLEPVTLTLSVGMIVLEIVLGITLLLGYMRQATMVLLLLLIAFFTFLTGYTTITGNVTDCGCFGDFLKLEPFQSFIKDLILSAMIIVLYIGRQHIQPILSNKLAGGITGASVVGFLIFCFSNFAWDLPMVDFRPYKVGNHVPDLMTVAEDKRPVYKYTFVYVNEETGEKKDFDDMNNLPGAPWKFDSRKDVLVKAGETAKIENFVVANDDGEDISEQLLTDENYSFMVVAYDLEKTHAEAFVEKLNPIAMEAEKAGYDFYAMTSSHAENFRFEVQAAYPFYSADGTFLKTIIRSNPGLVLWKNGTVVGKWHHSKIPTFDELKRDYLK